MLGSTLVTIQTGPEGKQVNRLYLEQGIDIDRELYLPIVLDRAVGRNMVMASTEGGTEIEEVAEETPERIVRQTIDPAIGLAEVPGRRSCRRARASTATPTARRRPFLTDPRRRSPSELDTDLIEINPLVVTKGGQVMALDGKMSFDDNALFRHPDVAEHAGRDRGGPGRARGLQARAVSYIKLDGTIGCMVNGAGLAMATMDIIKYVGGEPANFLDVGGGADAEQVAAAFRIITKDPNVKGIFVNIFGGIMRCDTIATGVVEAVKQVGLDGAPGGTARRDQRRAGQADHRRVRSRRGDRRRHEGRGPEDRGAAVMSVLVDSDTRVIIQGLGKTGQFHTDKAIAYGTQMVGAVHPSRAGEAERFEGETDHSGVPGSTRHLPGGATHLPRRCEEAVAETGANASVVYVPPPFAADAIMEAADAEVAADRRHHRGHPGDRHDEGQALSRGQTGTPGRSQLPRGDHPEGVQDRDHARVHPPAGPDRGGEPVGNPHLRGGVPADAARAGPDDGHRHRRRPGQRHQLRRRASGCSTTTRRPKGCS